MSRARMLMLLAILGPLGGCVGLFYNAQSLTRRRRTVEYGVVDGDTGVPLGGARVSIGYSGEGVGDASAITDSAGTVRLRVARQYGSRAFVSADGAMSRTHFLRKSRLTSRSSASTTRRRSASCSSCPSASGDG